MGRVLRVRIPRTLQLASIRTQRAAWIDDTNEICLRCLGALAHPTHLASNNAPGMVRFLQAPSWLPSPIRSDNGTAYPRRNTPRPHNPRQAQTRGMAGVRCRETLMYSDSRKPQDHETYRHLVKSSSRLNFSRACHGLPPPSTTVVLTHTNPKRAKPLSR